MNNNICFRTRQRLNETVKQNLVNVLKKMNKRRSNTTEEKKLLSLRVMFYQIPSPAYIEPKRERELIEQLMIPKTNQNQMSNQFSATHNELFENDGANWSKPMKPKVTIRFHSIKR